MRLDKPDEHPAESVSGEPPEMDYPRDNRFVDWNLSHKVEVSPELSREPPTFPNHDDPKYDGYGTPEQREAIKVESSPVDLQDALKKILKEDGWHISDGVDSCSGWDEEAMAESISRIAAHLREGR